jgi:Protein of unknown function (DUF1566)
MKRLPSALIGVVASIVLAAPALADPGTTWDKKISGRGRFKVLRQFGGAAVLDKETGRVWEQAPEPNAVISWFAAIAHCYQRTVGGRSGWRLPSIEELASLWEPDNPTGNPDLPPGHPFDAQPTFYWSSNSDAANPGFALGVDFGLGNTGSAAKSNDLISAWCVRGGQGIDGVQ